MTHARTLLNTGTKVFWALVAAALIFTLTANGAQANHQPADKAVASGSKVEIVPGPQVAGPGGTELLSTTFRSSSTSDLMVHVSMECQILTNLKNQGGTNSGRTTTSEAEGQIRAWLEFDGKIVPINDTSTNPQPGHEAIGNDSDKVTFCENERKQTVTDAEDPMDGHDTLETYLRTKQANAFNWIRLNTGSGIHTLKLMADLRTETVGDPANVAEGLVGNRMMIVEPTKMSNHASF